MGTQLQVMWTSSAVCCMEGIEDGYSSEVADQSENRRPSMGDGTNKTLGAETQLIQSKKLIFV